MTETNTDRTAGRANRTKREQRHTDIKNEGKIDRETNKQNNIKTNREKRKQEQHTQTKHTKRTQCATQNGRTM